MLKSCMAKVRPSLADPGHQWEMVEYDPDSSVFQSSLGFMLNFHVSQRKFLCTERQGICQ